MFVFKLPLPLCDIPTTRAFSPAPSFTPSTRSVVELVKQRDSYQNQHVCVVCGPYPHTTGKIPSVNIIRIISIEQSDQSRWRRWKRTGFLPSDVQDSTKDPRNALSLCESHQEDFFEYRFFLRWLKEADGYIFVDFRGPNSTCPHHGQKVFLSQASPYAPLPFLLLTHEAQARAHWPMFSEYPISTLIQPTFPFTTPKIINLPTDLLWHGLVPQQARVVPSNLQLLSMDYSKMTPSFPSLPLVSLPDAYMHDSKTLLLEIGTSTKRNLFVSSVGGQWDPSMLIL
uniref:HNH nuclease domain-containing protein n=1 Tax=Moniliophthora roreri TaxID=221103 RepID=A0A0W0EUN7_MONRR